MPTTLVVPTKLLLKNIDFSLRYGEILGIAGLMGAGRTELVLSIWGAYDGKVKGQILIDGIPVRINSPQDAISHGIGFVSEDRKRFGLILDANLETNMTLASLNQMTQMGIIDRNQAFHQTSHYVESMQIKSPSLETAVKKLSGGNQQKMVLGKWLMTQPKILFLDEPTRGIDVGAKVEIHALINQLAQQGVAIIIISSELPEILGVSSRIIVLHEGEITGRFTNQEVTQEDILQCAAGRTLTKAYTLVIITQ